MVLPPRVVPHSEWSNRITTDQLWECPADCGCRQERALRPLRYGCADIFSPEVGEQFSRIGSAAKCCAQFSLNTVTLFAYKVTLFVYNKADFSALAILRYGGIALPAHERFEHVTSEGNSGSS